MSVTVATIEVEESKLAGDYVTGSASSNGGAGGDTFPTTSEDVASRPAQSWQRNTIEITSGARDGDVRPVKNTTLASGIVTFEVSPVFGAQILSAVTFRVHRYPRKWKIDAINDALAEINDVLPRVVVEEFLSGQLARNGNMEQWRGNTPYDWEVVTGTITRETSITYQHRTVLKFASSASDDYVRQYILMPRDLRNETLSLEAYAKGAATNGAYISIGAGGTASIATVTSTDWTKLSVTHAVSDGLQPVAIDLHKGTSATITYFDAVHCKINSQTGTSVIPISEAFRSVRSVERRRGIDQAAATLQSELDYAVQPYQRFPMPDEIHSGYGHYPGIFPRDDYMRVLGVGIWPTVDDDADTVDITLDQVPLVAGRAAIKLLERALADGGYAEKDELNATLGRLRGNQVIRERLLAVKPPTKRIPLPLRGR